PALTWRRVARGGRLDWSLLGALRQSRALARIAHDRVAVIAQRIDGNPPALRRVLDRVVEQVEEELRETVGLATHRWQIGRRREVERHAGLVRLRLERGARRREERRGIHTLARELLHPRLQPRDLQQPLD